MTEKRAVWSVASRNDTKMRLLLDQLPSEPHARPVVDTLAGVHTIQGPSLTEDITKIDGYAAGRTITPSPLVADRTHHVCFATPHFFLSHKQRRRAFRQTNSKDTPSATATMWR